MTAIITDLKWITDTIKRNEREFQEKDWLRICGIVEELTEVLENAKLVRKRPDSKRKQKRAK